MLNLFTIIYGIMNWRYGEEALAVLNGTSAAHPSSKKIMPGLNSALQSVTSLRIAMGILYFAVIAFLIFKLLGMH